MEFKVSAVVKKNNKWFIGFLDGPEFKKTKEIKRLKDVKEVSDYKTFKRFLKDRNLSSALEEVVLKQLNLDSIYILDKPIEPSIKEFNAWWWSDYNKMCLNCNKDCKQSHRAKLIFCPSFEEVK